MKRLAPLCVAALASLALAAPASAQDPTGGCEATSASGSKQTFRCRLGPIAVAPYGC